MINIKCNICENIKNIKVEDHSLTKATGCNNCNKLKRATKDFRKRAINKFNYTYNYDNVSIMTIKDEINLVCKEHNIVNMKAEYHLQSITGCKLCESKVLEEKRRKTNSKRFVDKAKEIYIDMYDYSNINYISQNDKVGIICIKCNNSFNETPSNHLYKNSGCPNCYTKRTVLYTYKCFIKVSNERHNNYYNYSKTRFNDITDEVIIICPVHKEFIQVAKNHYNGSGCKDCGFESSKVKQTKTREEFIEEAMEIHGNLYDYTKVVYNGANKRTIFGCNKEMHPYFQQTPSKHLNTKGGCVVCFGGQLTTETFIIKAREKHGNLYGYDQVKYVDGRKEVQIKCKKHDYYLQKPEYHLSGAGCHRCKNRKNEEIIRKHLEKLEINYIDQHKITIKNTKLFCDFYIEEYNLIVEYDGESHFSPINYGGSKDIKQIKEKFDHGIYNHDLKDTYAKDNNINILRIPYWENKNIIHILNALLVSENIDILSSYKTSVNRKYFDVNLKSDIKKKKNFIF